MARTPNGARDGANDGVSRRFPDPDPNGDEVRDRRPSEQKGKVFIEAIMVAKLQGNSTKHIITEQHVAISLIIHFKSAVLFQCFISI